MKTCKFIGMLLQDRLRSALHDAGLSANGLAKLVGVSHVAVGQWLSGASKNIKGATAIKVASALGVNLDWLLTGSGPRKGAKAEPVIAVDGPILPDDCVQVPITKIENRLFGEQQMRDKNRSYFNKGIFEFYGVQPENCRVLELASDNMAPILKKGSQVLYDVTDTECLVSGLYVVNVRGNLMACKLIPQLNGSITLQSTNPDFDPIMINRENLHKDFIIEGKILLATIFF